MYPVIGLYIKPYLGGLEGRAVLILGFLEADSLTVPVSYDISDKKQAMLQEFKRAPINLQRKNYLWNHVLALSMSPLNLSTLVTTDLFHPTK